MYEDYENEENKGGVGISVDFPKTLKIIIGIILILGIILVAILNSRG